NLTLSAHRQTHGRKDQLGGRQLRVFQRQKQLCLLCHKNEQHELREEHMFIFFTQGCKNVYCLYF
ncbi:hypothetical protein L9F63_000718, partial [Diploptera punctata]